MRVFREIEVADLFNLLEEDKNKVKLIDIRDTGEYDLGAIPGSENLPVHVLAEKMNELDRNKTLVFYCQVGIRSAQICARRRSPDLAVSRTEGLPLARPLCADLAGQPVEAAKGGDPGVGGTPLSILDREDLAFAPVATPERGW